MLARTVSLLSLVLLLGTAAAQDPRPLTHADYDGWKRISSRSPSPDGSWIAWIEAPAQGDGLLVVHETAGDRRYEIPRGQRPRFSPCGRFLITRISEKYEDRMARERKQLLEGRSSSTSSGRSSAARGGGRAAAMRARFGMGRGGRGGGAGGADALTKILDLETGKITDLNGVSSVSMPSEGPSWIVFQRTEKKKEEAKADEGEKKAEAGEGERRQGRRAGRRGRMTREQRAERMRRMREQRGAGQATARAEVTEEKPVKPAKPEQSSKPGSGSVAAGLESSEKAAEARSEKTDEKNEKKSWRKAGKKLVLRELATGKEIVLEDVVTHSLMGKKGHLVFARNTTVDSKSESKLGLFAHILGTEGEMTIVDGAADFVSMTADRDGNHMAFLSNRRDREAEKPTMDVWLWDMTDKPAKMVVSHTQTQGFPADHTISRSGLSWSRDGSALRLSLAPAPKPEIEKVLARDEVTLDIWHWKDPLLQPMQARGGRRGGGNSMAAVWHTDQDRLLVMSQHPRESIRFLTPDGSRALVTDSTPYAQEISWDGRYSDIYVMNTIDGSRELLANRVGGRTSTSPCGRWVLRFADARWYAHDLVKGTITDLTGELDVSFENELHDTPSTPRSYGIAGWADDKATVLLNDRYDVWAVALDGSSAEMVTDGVGRATKIQFRYERVDGDERYVKTGTPVMFEGLNTRTMAMGFWEDVVGAPRKPKKLIEEELRLSDIAFSDNGERVFFSKARFDMAPEVWTASAKDWSGQRQLSNLGKQQDAYKWGKAELVRWRNMQGREIEGILVKPDDFDPNKKYPMMVYFYERRSDRLHSYVNPAPGTSPNASYYVSNGYLWFVPDIYYREGYPGESALSCVVSGVQHLVNKGFVQEDAIGAAGHSWGGYQTAYLVTRTNIFKAIESGAPVSNMTSAYGGIRWSSGMVRQFQYEKTQSRIGGTLWDYPMRYIENSPVFWADKVETPVLMLHNDEDGAVPWYQGIEFFTALRRLGKEAYMFNYNGAGHGLSRRAEQKDWTKRMQQYFDHHLKGAPAPDWMKHGVPYAERMREKRTFSPETIVRPEPKKPEAKPAVEVQPRAKPTPAEPSGSQGN